MPILPLIAGESLTSYLNRAATWHANMSVFKFLEFIELSQASAMVPNTDVLARLSRLLGHPQSVFENATFLSLGGRKRSFCGEEIHVEFANLARTSYCPACLLEDGYPDSPSRGFRVGRVHWQIEQIRTCEKHLIGLERRKNTHHSEKFQLMSVVAPEDKVLAEAVKEAPYQRVSGLQTYVLNRLSGEVGPAWLDGQPIDLAARACEMIGVILTAGTHVNLKALSDAEWNEAGHVGYGYASRGEEGITEALQLALDRFNEGGLGGGPQKIFGRLYQWLQFNKNNKPVGPIKKVVREFILDTLPLDIGTDLFGEPVDCQRVHTAHSLSKKTNAHYKTIHRAMVLAGLMDGDPDKVSRNGVFDARAGEALMARVQNSISVLGLQEYLNCNRVQAQQLVRTGVVPLLIPDAKVAKGVLKQVATEDADAFLERLLSASTKVDEPSTGVMDIISAAEVSRWPVMEIVNGILSGLFGTVEVVDPDKKFKGVLVHPREVRECLSREKSRGRVGLDEGARIIGMPPHGLSALSKLRKADGSTYVGTYFFENSKGVRIRLFAVEELLQFLQTHISLKDFAEKHWFSAKVMKMKLDGRGLVPIAPKYELGRIWYRRNDLPTF
ncbi:TniQ family protein [uncultured Pelagimonas sp.]|uniref:TniQ family protein n=1 Tax=uncultured Pelagimonas sp. TaxID=1618102 RepID=UPI002629D9C3|nr:TniQ family protein [uncultured Pelagimonas sp.]